MPLDETRFDEQTLIHRIASLEEASARLAARVDAVVTRLFEVERVASTQWLSDSELRSPGASIMLDELVVPVTMRLPASLGFHKLEYTSESQAFRWTGPLAEFGFNGYVNRQRTGMLELDVLWHGPNTDVALTRCFVDNEEVALTSEKVSDGWILKGVIPPRNSFRLTAFRFMAPEVFKISNVGDALGLAVRRFTYRIRPPEDAQEATP